MSELAKKHWALIIAVCVSISFAALYISGTFIDNYDAAGHQMMIEGMRQFWPSPTGWDNGTFLGHMYGEAYPVLLHWIMTGFSFAVGVELAMKLTVAASIIALPIAIYWYLSKRKNRNLELFAILGLLMLLPGYIGSNFSGLFIYGLLPAFAALPLLFALFGSIDRIQDSRRFTIISALLFISVILSHLVVAIIAGIFVLVKLLSEKSSKNRQRIILVAISGAIAGTPLAVAMITNTSSVVQTSYTVSSLFAINVVLLIGVSIIVFKYKLWQKLFESRVALILLLIVCLMPLLAKVSSLSLLHHAYRLQLFAYIFAILTVVGAIKFKAKHLRILTIAAALSLILLSAYKIKDYRDSEVTVTINSQISGRFIESFRRTESFPAPYAAQQQLVSKGGQWANGLFIETAPNAPFVQSLIKSLRPSAYSDLGSNIDEVIKSPDDTKKLLDLFGISHVISLDKNPDNAIGSMNTSSSKLYYHDQTIDNSGLVTALKPSELKPVLSNWNQTVERWWHSDINNYLYDASSGEITAKSPARDVKVTEYSNNKIIIDIDSDRPAPVLIKETYNPKWRAQDKNGDPVAIHKFSPFLMMIEAQGRITLSI